MVKKKSAVNHEVKHEEVATKKKSKVSNVISKLSSNYWMVATIILALVLILSLTVNMAPSETKIGEQTVAFLNNQTGGGVSLVSVDNNKTFYTVVVSYQGQQIPVYISSDGKNLFQGLMPMVKATTKPSTNTNTNTQTTTIPKSDKPTVELYVWGYCPYGVQAQGPLAQVANLLGKTATFTVVPYHDGHGAFETQQNKIQLCIEQLASDKYWNYAAGFVKTIYPKCSSTRDIACDKTESVALMKSLGIDSTAVMSCVDQKGTALFDAAKQKASVNKVQGSPTLIINGVIANVARTADAYKTAVCSAYNTAPAECSQKLDSTAAAAAGNC